MHGRDAQVVEVLRNLSQHEELAEAIDFGRLGVEEVAALGRVLGTLSREERRTPFWIDISDRVCGGSGNLCAMRARAHTHTHTHT